MFDEFEGSVEDASPVETYAFTEGANAWFYNSSDVPVTIDSQVYEPLSLDRRQLLQGGDERFNAFDVELPATTPFVLPYRTSVPPTSPQLIVRRFHATDPDLEARLAFIGTVESVSFRSNGRVARVTTKPDIAGADRTFQRIFFQGGCNHVLYDSECGVDRNSPLFKASDVVVSDVTTFTVTIPGLSSSFAANWFVGGYVESSLPTDRRWITAQNGDTLTLLFPFNSGLVGQAVDVFAGCRHDVGDCSVKFSAFANYGGDPYIVKTNPFSDGVN